MTFTKEQLIEKLQHRISVASGFPESEKAQIDLELARIALASLEAEPAIHRWRRVTSEPYGPYPWHYVDFIGFSEPVDGIEDEYFYSAPPEPANAEPVAWLWSHRKHPSEVSLVRPEDDERAEGAHWSGWSCQALYAAPPAPVSVPAAMNTDDDFDSAFEHGKAVGWNAYRAAMLQGARNAESRCSNSPVIPDGWFSVIDQTPDEYDFDIWVFSPSIGVQDGVQWDGLEFADDEYQFRIKDVSHWMKKIYPAAPQKE